MYKRIFPSIVITFLICINVLFASERITIGISKASGSENYEKYGNWLLKLDSNINIIDFYKIGIDSALKVVEKCNGLLLSGGPDVHPNFYNRPEDEPLCSIDNKRDTLEFALIRKALKRKIPILAICRGLQIMNVALGGTLIADIPTQYSTSIIHQEKDTYEVYHLVSITNAKEFKKFLGYLPTNLSVNSNHHQAIGSMSKQLIGLAKSVDGICEMITWKDWRRKPFLIGVQWHPERLWDKNPELSDTIGVKFIKEVRKYKRKK